MQAPAVWVVKLLKIKAPTAAFMLLQNGIVAFENSHSLYAFFLTNSLYALILLVATALFGEEC